VHDVISTLREQLVEQSKNFEKTHPQWRGSSKPTPGEAAAFVGLTWRMARMRMLDELRHVYVSKKAAANLLRRDGYNIVDQLDARQRLTLLARYVDELSGEDKELLISVIDCTHNGAFTSAQRTKLHRLRHHLTEKLSEIRKPVPRSGRKRP